jgi:hypothetical protein
LLKFFFKIQDPNKEFGEIFVLNLKKKLKEFLILTSKAIELAVKLSKPENKPLNEIFIESYEELKILFNPFIQNLN